MSIEKGKRFKDTNIFISYDYEQVFFRWDHLTKKVYKKFYNEEESLNTVPYDNRLFNDSLLYGNEITEEEYIQGRSINNEQS